MAAFTSIALATAAIVGAGATVYGQVKQGEARDEARKQQEKMLAEQKQKEADYKSADDAKNKRETEMATNRAQQQAQRSRQSALQSQKKGRRGTLLTGPSGLSGQGQAAGKSLLGI